MNFYRLLEKSIIKVVDNDTKIAIKTVEIKEYSAKYSSAKNPCHKLFINGVPIKKNWQIHYKCLNGCGSISEICGKSMDRKIRNKVSKCFKCKEDDEEKQKKQSEFIKNNPITTGSKKVLHKPTIDEKINNSIDLFSNESEDFVQEYFERHLTEKEFNKIIIKIITINGKIFDIRKGYQYIEAYRIGNALKYYPRLLYKNKIIKLEYFEFECDACGDIFIRKYLYKLKNKRKLLCSRCSFCNCIFKIKSTTNIIGDKIVYQSNIEKTLINFCNQNNIVINNGPKIDYEWNNISKKYYLDFDIPEYGLLIETKDRHIWHIKQVNNGIWQAKIDAATDYSKKNNRIFITIFPEHLEGLKSLLLLSKKI